MTGSGGRGGFGSSPLDPAEPPFAGPVPPGQVPPELPDFQPTEALPQLRDEVRFGVRQDQKNGSGGPRQPDEDDGAKPKDKPKRKHSLALEIVVLVVIAMLLALGIKTWVLQAFFIPSGSMQNTLAIGDRILVNKAIYHFRGIARGDIVVFNGDGSWDPQPAPSSSNVFVRFFDDAESVVGISHSDNIYIKRVIGLPGDHVVCCNAQGQITVNGVALQETSYLYPDNAPSAQKFNITVPPGRLWVMGDHRAISYDSRGHMGDPGGGTIPESAVLGRAFVIVWPPSQVGFLNIPATFEQPKLTASAAAAGGNTKALATALNDGVPIRQTGTALPLALGFAGAVPLTVLQAFLRRRISARRSRRRARRG
jgi:signal peptidase I